jgi:hypothetical protein
MGRKGQLPASDEPPRELKPWMPAVHSVIAGWGRDAFSANDRLRRSTPSSARHLRFPRLERPLVAAAAAFRSCPEAAIRLRYPTASTEML